MNIQQVTPLEAQRLIQSGHAYIDVRTESEFAGGHPLGAVNIPVVQPDPRTGQIAPNPDFLTTMQAHFRPDTALVVGCQAGGRSQRAADILAQAGFTNVTNMQGGFGGARDATGRVIVSGWKDSNLPVCKDCGAANTYAALRRST